MTEKICDIVVLGGGGSGLTAALRAAQLSGKKVIVVEKSPNTGGGMVMASTMRTFRSKWQKERGIEDRTESYLRKVMDATYWRLDPELVGNAVLATGKFFDWFLEIAGEEQGEKFHVGRYVFDGEDGQEGPQMGGPGGITGGGRLFMDTLRDKADEYGVEILTRHAAKDMDVVNGQITAVLADGPEGEVRITCKQCILATGSWIHNEEVAAKVSREFVEAKRFMGPSAHMNANYTGDGFKITKKLNPKLGEKDYSLRMMGPMVMSKSGVMANMGNSPFTLAINTLGKRYICEPSQIRNGVFNSGLMMMEQPKGYVYIMFDSNNLEAAIRDNNEHPKPPRRDIFGLPPFPVNMEEAVKDVAAAMEKENDKIFVADTVAGLAEKMDVDAVSLEKTVADYNNYCENGFDATCFKDSGYLVPCNKSPYYAVRASLGTDGAFGGIEINGNMQAYAADGSLLPNLYVTGDFASGRFINRTGEKVQILNDMSWALASGFLAGTNAAKAI